MAGDWIKIEHWTPDKPEVFRIAELLTIDPDAVSGKLLRIWIWADQQTIDGNAAVTQMYAKCNAGGVTKKLIDRLASVTGFADAMVAVGWLEEVAGGVVFVNFDRHNGETAKKRAQTAKRVKKSRDGVTQMKRECNAESVTESATSALPEKRREESKDTASAVSKCSPENRRFEKPTVADVAAYCGERQNAVDPQAFVDFYESKGWKIGNQPMKNWKAAVRTWERSANGITGRNHQPATAGGREGERIQRTLATIADFVNEEDPAPLLAKRLRPIDGGAGGPDAHVRNDTAADSSLVRRPRDLPGPGGQCSNSGTLPD